jgi:carbonic anhydrase/acetyltransferase-like protein (isoleucine patch superfamily)
MPLYALDDREPQVHPTAWVADTAQLIGDVRLAPDSSVWFGCVLRGDNEPLVVGRGSNVQECTVMHTDRGFPLVIGDGVTVGHQATLHGCSIGDGALIGIQAIVLNGARIGRHCLVAAGSLVTEGREFPDGTLIMGSPAKVVRELDPAQIERLRHGAAHYVDNARRYRAGLRRLA